MRHFFSPRRPVRSLVLLATLLLATAMIPMGILQTGLDTPQPLGKFLNDSLPHFTPEGPTGWQVVPAFPNLTFDDPLVFTPEPQGNYLYVASRDGVIERFLNDPATTTKTSFLDLSNQTAVVWDGGFLGLAFHPEFGVAGSPNRNYFYVYYCARQPGASYPTGQANGFFNVWLRLSRFTVPDGSTVADPASELVMINYRLFNSSHRGGGLVFGQDSMLYLTIGDQFRYGTAQDIVTTLEGGVLRLDVNSDPAKSHPPIRTFPADLGETDEVSGVGYYIPNDNPFLDPTGNQLEEYYTVGNRAPHRLTMDKVTGRLWSGEIGGGAREEINVIEKGKNYGWPFREGTIAGPQAQPATITGTLREPVLDFLRNEANAIIGGYVYRGTATPSLDGKYLCGDYGQNRIWSVTYDPVSGTGTKQYLCQFTPGALSSFGQDNDGEVYLLGLGNNRVLYKLEPLGLAPPAPALLSETGLFTDLATLTPTPGVIPYELNVPFWSDAAIKTRWMAIPNNGTHNTAAEQIAFTETGEWMIPRGAVLVKHFEMVIDETTGARRRLETRLMVRGDDDVFYGLTYKWRLDNSDADLLATGLVEPLTIMTPTGSRLQNWEYPDRATCLVCHNTAAGYVLGPKTRQLNGHAYYPSTGRDAHQLETLIHLGIIPAGAFDLNDTSTVLTSAPTTDTSYDLELRARSYLDANCAYCHRPGTGNRGVFDARLNVPLFAQQFINGAVSDDLGITGAKVIVPQDTALSMLYQRLNSLHQNSMMPPIAKNLVDTAGVRVVAEWIMGLNPTAYEGGAGLTATYFSGMNFGTPLLTRIDSVVNFNWGNGSPDPLVPDNLFSVRWEGEIQPIFSETYTFKTTTDDGVRLWVNGQLIINQWVDQGPTAHAGTIALVSGQKVTIKMEYYENGGGAVAQLLWSSANQPEEVVPQRFLFPQPGQLAQTINFAAIGDKAITDPAFALNATSSSGLPVTYALISGPASLSGNILTLSGVEGTVVIEATQGGNSYYQAAAPVQRSFDVRDPANIGTGLMGTYFDNIDYTGAELARLDPTINFEWGNGAPDPSMGNDNFSVRWEGQVMAEFAETYTFRTRTDDGVRLWVNGTLIIDQWVPQAPTSHTGTIALPAGTKVDIRMDYYEQGGGAVAQLFWSSASQVEEIVPAAHLFPPPAVSFPVAWLAFEAKGVDEVVELTWVTGREENSAGFTVERSRDGQAFSALEAVPSQGDSETPQVYFAVDQQPLPGTNYYRLRHTDLDGSTQFSTVLRVTVAEAPLSVFPNPVGRDQSLWIALGQAPSQPLDLRLYDSRGRAVMQREVTPDGQQTLFSLPLPNLPAGMYSLVIRTDRGREVRKVILR